MASHTRLRALLFIASLLLVGCGQALSGRSAAPAPPVAASLPPPAVATWVSGPPPSPTPWPTSTVGLPAGPTPVVTPRTVALAPAGASLNPLPAGGQLDRSCPDPPPAKPEFERYAVDPRGWPAPLARPEGHFWLAPPLAGNDHVVYTSWLPYGWDDDGNYLLHTGIDLAQPLGTPLLAVADGRVVVAGDDLDRLYGWRCDWYGELVVIRLDEAWQEQPVYALYGHVLELAVVAGQRVEQGDSVAEVGFGGVATHPHLHFEVRVGANAFEASRNPLLWFQPARTRGVLAGRLVDSAGRPWQSVEVELIARSVSAPRRTTWTYLNAPLRLANPDEQVAENFAFGNVLPGRHEVRVRLNGRLYEADVFVHGGELATVEIVTGP
ncbi:MAG: M23 family metallopeptidase [Candidatus Promineifilaceae bacterium]